MNSDVWSKDDCQWSHKICGSMQFLPCLSLSLLCLVGTFGESVFSRSSTGLGKVFTQTMSSDNSLFVDSFQEYVLNHIEMRCDKGQQYLSHLATHPSIPFTFPFPQSNWFFAFCSQGAVNRGLSLLFAGSYREFVDN